MLAVVAAAALAVAAAIVPGCVTVNPYYEQSKAHHQPGGFQNIDPTAVPRPFSDFLRSRSEMVELDESSTTRLVKLR